MAFLNSDSTKEIKNKKSQIVITWILLRSRRTGSKGKQRKKILQKKVIGIERETNSNKTKNQSTKKIEMI